MKNKDKIFEKFNREKVLQIENVAPNVSSKFKKIKSQEVPKEYTEKYEDVEREKLISQLFFFESQVFYLENLLEEIQEKVKLNESEKS